MDLYNYKNLFTVASKHTSEGRLLGLRVSWGLGSLTPNMVPVDVLWRGKRTFSCDFDLSDYKNLVLVSIKRILLCGMVGWGVIMGFRIFVLQIFRGFSDPKARGLTRTPYYR